MLLIFLLLKILSNSLFFLNNSQEKKQNKEFKCSEIVEEKIQTEGSFKDNHKGIMDKILSQKYHFIS